MTYEVKFMQFPSTILKYWCVLGDGKVLWYYLSRVDAYDKLKELKDE